MTSRQIHQKNSYRIQRLLLGISAVAFATLAMTARFFFEDSANSNAGFWIYGSFGKVAIVLAMAWLAWPQLLWLKDIPGGGTVMIAIGIGAAIFVARPRLLLYFVPLLVTLTSILLAIAWFQRNFLPPK